MMCTGAPVWRHRRSPSRHAFPSSDQRTAARGGIIGSSLLDFGRLILKVADGNDDRSPSQKLSASLVPDSPNATRITQRCGAIPFRRNNRKLSACIMRLKWLLNVAPHSLSFPRPMYGPSMSIAGCKRRGFASHDLFSRPCLGIQPQPRARSHRCHAPTIHR